MILNTEKERIDSGFFLHQAEVKKKKEKVDKRRKEEDESKSASIELGAMVEWIHLKVNQTFPLIAVMRISSTHKKKK